MKPCFVKIPVAVAVFLLIVLLSGCIKDRQETGAGLRPGDKLPEFSASFSDGTTVNVPKDLAGKVSCIVLFNTSCPDCREELPVIQELHDLCPEVSILRLAFQTDLVGRREGRLRGGTPGGEHNQNDQNQDNCYTGTVHKGRIISAF